MDDALPLFGLAAFLSSVALVVWTVGRLWIRAKELERTATPPLSPSAATSITGLLAQVEARIARLERSVDLTAIEVERLAEAPRFASQLLVAAGDTAPAAAATAGSPARPTRSLDGAL